MAGKIILVTGGARSGKSTFAERYARSAGGRIAYIATAQAYDAEMRRRIELHRARRPADWTTYEAPFGAERVFLEAAKTHDTILFDCLTIYTSNLLLAAPAGPERSEKVVGQVRRVLDAARRSEAAAIFVTNELGMGIVPENALAREFRDVAGWVNQAAAAAAAAVYLVVSGIATELKSTAVSL